jgi:NhaP-type Na+/H+ or K+/H+ antiporter
MWEGERLGEGARGGRPGAMGRSQTPQGADVEETRLRESALTVLVILVFTLSVWVFFYVMTPATPLTIRETTVLVGVCTIVVLLLRWVASRICRRGSRDDHAP